MNSTLCIKITGVSLKEIHQLKICLTIQIYDNEKVFDILLDGSRYHPQDVLVGLAKAITDNDYYACILKCILSDLACSEKNRIVMKLLCDRRHNELLSGRLARRAYRHDWIEALGKSVSNCLKPGRKKPVI